MQADDISCGEKMELRFYKCVTLIPTTITMLLLLTLSVYYIFVSASNLTVKFYLRPLSMGDFYNTIGIEAFWDSEEAKNTS